jgi:hypothetical protein
MALVLTVVTYGLGVDFASDKNEYKKFILGGEVWSSRKADNLIAIIKPIG